PHTADERTLLVQVHYFVGLRTFSKVGIRFRPNRAESAATMIPALSTNNRRGSVVIPRVFATDDSKLPSANASSHGILRRRLKLRANCRSSSKDTPRTSSPLS